MRNVYRCSVPLSPMLPANWSSVRNKDKAGTGCVSYIGSLKSEVYFCVYEKSYEQYIKLGIPIEEAPIKNRFEIRLKNERAYYAVRDLLTYYDAERDGIFYYQPLCTLCG